MTHLRNYVERVWQVANARADLVPAHLLAQMHDVVVALHIYDTLTHEQMNIVHMVNQAISEGADNGYFVYRSTGVGCSYLAA